MILGAGFSRAISDHMPLTDELGNAVLRWESESDGDEGRFSGGYFEAWLSRLAEDQPDLSAADNMANRARFLRLSEGIFRLLSDCQGAATRDGLPDWLFDLLSILHARRATVVTFNWDTLIEAAAEARLLYDWQEGTRVSWSHLIDHLPPFPPGPARFGHSDARSLRLHKLHGSLNWLWTSGDETGATLARWESVTPPTTIEDEHRRRQSYPGREPFIIPPAASKSSYFRNPLTRELWQQAASALRETDHVALLGYSIPATDLTVSGMLADSIRRDATRLTLANPDPEPVLQRLEFLGIERGQATAVASLEDFTARHVSEAAKELAMWLRMRLRQLTPYEADYPIVAAWQPHESGAVLDSLPPVRGVLTLRAEDRGRWEGATGRRDEHRPSPMTLGELRRIMDASPVHEVRIDMAGSSWPVVACYQAQVNEGYRDRWAVLVPVGIRNGLD